MRKTLAVFAVFALTLSLFALPTLASHEVMPKNIPGLSATSLPDVSQFMMTESGKEDFGVWQEYESNGFVVAYATSMPWAPDKVVVWEWRVPNGNGGWQYFAAFSPETITETVPEKQIFQDERNASGNITAITVTLLDKNGKASGVSKTFTKP